MERIIGERPLGFSPRAMVVNQRRRLALMNTAVASAERENCIASSAAVQDIKTSA
jgi:hypothetical protein